MVPSTLFGLSHAPFYIGHVAGCPGGAVMMDSVQILSRVMSAAEVAAIGAPHASMTATLLAPDSLDPGITSHP